MSQSEPPVEIDTAANPDAAVIWLHGLGADGHDFEPVVGQLALAPGSRIRFIFPHAPHRPVTLNGGYVMRAWYDLYASERGARQDREGLEEARQVVDALIQRESERGIPPSRIVLMGFSQGGAVALHSGLRRDEPVAGIGALSTYLPLHHLLAEERHPSSHETPIFMAHGRHDPVIAYDIGISSRDHLREHGYRVDWREYPMEHSLCAEEIDDIARWLNQRLAEGD